MDDDIPKPKEKPLPPAERRIFLNNMNSWISKFIISQLRTDTISTTKPFTKNIFMGTISPKKPQELPFKFYPEIIKIDTNSKNKNRNNTIHSYKYNYIYSIIVLVLSIVKRF